jgi:hypothetical protein
MHQSYCQITCSHGWNHHPHKKQKNSFQQEMASTKAQHKLLSLPFDLAGCISRDGLLSWDNGLPYKLVQGQATQQVGMELC